MATRDDATLLVQLAQWGAQINLGEGLGAIFREDFDPDAADAADPSIRTVLVFGETVGTLVKNELFDRDLCLDWLWVDGMWQRVGPAARRARADYGSDRLYENFEALAQAQRA